MPWSWGSKVRKQPALRTSHAVVAASPIDPLVRVHQSALLEVNEKERYTCRVYDFAESFISLSAPTDDNNLPVIVRSGTNVRVVLQSGNGFIGFAAKVIGPRVVNGVPVLDITKPKRIEKSDRREYYRVPVDLPMQYRLISEDLYRTCRIADISGGGLLCLIPRYTHIEHGSEFDIRLSLANIGNTIEARVVVRKVFEPAPRSDNIRVACEFLDIPPRTREAIIRYVAQRQLELIRAGVLHTK